MYFKGAWTYKHAGPETGTLRVRFHFPDAQGVYDGFLLTIDGVARDLRPRNGEIEAEVPVSPGKEVVIAIAYKSRGMDQWTYVPDPGVSALSDFHFALTTDFTDIDFPPSTLSPSTKERTGTGMKLGWDFERVITGHAIGMSMPKRIQPASWPRRSRFRRRSRSSSFSSSWCSGGYAGSTSTRSTTSFSERRVVS